MTDKKIIIKLDRTSMPGKCSVTDEAGKVIPNVTSVKIDIKLNELPRAVLEVIMPEVDIKMDPDQVEFYELCPWCKRKKEDPPKPKWRGPPWGPKNVRVWPPWEDPFDRI